MPYLGDDDCLVLTRATLLRAVSTYFNASLVCPDDHVEAVEVRVVDEEVGRPRYAFRLRPVSPIDDPAA